MRALSATLIVLSLAACGVAQSPAEALRAEPKSVGLKDIPDDFRSVAIGGSGELFPWMLLGAFDGGGNNRPSERLFFRALAAVWVQPDEFAELLDGKRARIRGYRLDIASFVGSETEGAPSFTESWLEAGRIVTWTPSPELNKAALAKAFSEMRNRDAEATVIETSDGSSPSAGAQARMSNLKQIATSILMYSGDNEDVFPKAEASSQLEPLILPYMKKREILAVSPEAGRVLFNTHLSGRSATSIEMPAETILLWEEKAWSDGKRAVAFTDGHVKRLDDAEWSKVWKRELARRAETRKTGGR